MPSKNSIKQYVEDSYYHIYNRGVEKRIIFLDQQDYGVCLSYLEEYLMPKDEDNLREKLSNPDISPIEKNKVLKALVLNNFAGEITVLAYCLMPNHFHLFIKQKNASSIDKFMQSLSTRYTMYFNHKYKRVGSLFQGVYKAVLVTSEAQFLHLSRYIHKQAISLQGETLQVQPSSYPEYLDTRHTEWVHPEEVLAYFSRESPGSTYKTFVEGEEDFDIIKEIALED